MEPINDICVQAKIKVALLDIEIIHYAVLFEVKYEIFQRPRANWHIHEQLRLLQKTHDWSFLFSRSIYEGYPGSINV